MQPLKRLFHHKNKKKEEEAKPLKIEGVSPAPMTPEPDSAEIAAQALLDRMAEIRTQEDTGGEETTEGSSEYYHTLAKKIHCARKASNLRASRFLTFCEQELKKPDLPKEGDGSLGLLEAELYKRIDTIEREGGELKERWQRCLARVTVRLMDIQD